MARAFTKFAFTDSVRRMQKEQGATAIAGNLEQEHVASNESLSPREIDFIQSREMFYQSTVTESGWPYVQYRGGPSGFLKVLDNQTLAYADFSGNRQYMSDGNLKSNNRISLILMDYPKQVRLKIWGKTELLEKDQVPDLIEQVHDKSYKATPERIIKISVVAFDWNCPRHIKPRYSEEELLPTLEQLHKEIKDLKKENERLAQMLSDQDRV